MRRTACASLLVIFCLGVAGCATLPANTQRDPRDPWERVNRTTYKFNSVVDRNFLRPVARTYVKVTPRPVRTGISNFLDNLAYPVTIVNDLLQLKFKQFGQDTVRFVANSTVGIGGIFDPAGSSGLEKHDVDLGQTFGHWGAGAGPYLVIPFLGPSDVRDGIGRVGDIWLDPRHYIRNNYVSYGLWGLGILDARARLLNTDHLLDSAYDPYSFLRNAYLQRRNFLINGGRPDKQQEQEQYEEEQRILEETEGGQPRTDQPQPPKE